MTDYFTTQSQATAFAAIEQGFEGYDVIPVPDCSYVESYLCNGSLTATFSPKYIIYRFPKTQHSVALMKLKEGDVIMGHGSVGQARYGGEYTKEGELKIKWIDGCWTGFYPEDGEVIIQRNNKPFPVWDKEGV